MEPATMAILGSGLASAFGNVYSNTLNAANAAKINQKNLDLQAAINLDNIEAARLNNVTAVDLANTAHQREVRDLRDAGLNPILSATGGNGAATPSLQSPNLDAPSLDRVDVVNPLSQIASAVGQAMQFEDQHKLSSLQSQILDGSLPTNPSDLKLVADASVQSDLASINSSVAQSKHDENRARLDSKLALMEERVIDETAKAQAGLPHDKRFVEPDLMQYVKDAFISDIKDRANRNWRNNTGAIMGALNSGVSAAASIKGMRNPQAIGSRTTLPNGKTLVTEKLFK